MSWNQLPDNPVIQYADSKFRITSLKDPKHVLSLGGTPCQIADVFIKGIISKVAENPAKHIAALMAARTRQFTWAGSDELQEHVSKLEGLKAITDAGDMKKYTLSRKDLYTVEGLTRGMQMRELYRVDSTFL